MSTKGCNWARSVRGVGPAKKAILFCLGERHNQNSGLCFPSQETLAADAEMSVRALQYHLKELVRMGLISRQVRSPKGRGRLTLYGLDFDRIEPVAGWENQSAEVADGSMDQGADIDMTQTQLRALSDNQNHQPESSVSNETGDDADLFEDRKLESKPSRDEDPFKSLIFTAGLKQLTDQGWTERSARAFLGSLIGQTNGDTSIVANAITACEKAKPGDAASWLKAAVGRRLPVDRPGPIGRKDSENVEARFAGFAQDGTWRSHWGPRPDAPEADYPDQLYEKHSLKRWARETTG